MNSNSNDEPLGPLLRNNWPVSPVKNPDFRTAVWARIESTRRAPVTWGAWLRLHAVRFTALAVVTVIISGVGGGWIAVNQGERQQEQLLQRYLASIDPHLKEASNNR